MTNAQDKSTGFTIVPVILCGGSGTRLWPASRESHPKQFLSLVGETSLLQNTLTRATRIAGVDMSSVLIVTLSAMKDTIIKQVSELSPVLMPHILCEPCARNTAAAVAAASLFVTAQFGPNAIMWVLPSDHHIGDEAALANAFSFAKLAAQNEHLVTFGIQPTRADTGYGYIRAREEDAGKSVMQIEQFVEKPDLATARQYLQSGHYMWNSGMFMFRADTVLGEFEAHAPSLLQNVRAAFSVDSKLLDGDTYTKVAAQPFDKAVMEKSKRGVVIPANPEWSDIGSWESLWDICKKDENNNVLDGNAVTLNAKNSLIHAKEKLIAVAGLENIVVVETEDAILIMNKNDNDSMRELIQKLKSTGAREVA